MFNETQNTPANQGQLDEMQGRPRINGDATEDTMLTCQVVRQLIWDKVHAKEMSSKGSRVASQAAAPCRHSQQQLTKEKRNDEKVESLELPSQRIMTDVDMHDKIPPRSFQSLHLSPPLLNELIQDPDLAKLGDAFVNFLFSLALSALFKRGWGLKISDSVLSEAIRRSKWWKDKTLHLKGKKGVVGNYVEALMLIAWAERWMSLDELLQTFLSTAPSLKKLDHHRTRREALIPSVTQLLDVIHDRYLMMMMKVKEKEHEKNGEK